VQRVTWLIARSVCDVMPKRRSPDKNHHTYRVELQQHERETLDTLAASMSVNNVLSGVGNLLTPFSDVMGVIIAAWIAKEGVDSLHQSATKLATTLWEDDVDEMIEDYKAKQKSYGDRAKAIVQNARDENRELTQEEMDEVNRLSELHSESFGDYQKKVITSSFIKRWQKNLGWLPFVTESDMRA